MAAAIDTTEKFVGITTTTGNVSNGADARELIAFFRGYEADVRFKSTFSAMLAALAGVALGSGPPAGYDPYVDVLDRISEGTKIRRRLARMSVLGHEREARVLERLYGPRNVTTERPEFGDLAPIIELTAAAQDLREEVVLEESTVRSERVTPRVIAVHAERRNELEVMFWEEAGVVMKLERSIARANRLDASIEKTEAHIKKLDERIETTAGSHQERAISRRGAAHDTLRRLEGEKLAAPARLRDLHRRHRAGRQLLKQLLDGFAYDGSVRAEIGAIECTDREITVADAIRVVMDHRPSRKHHARRPAFLASALEQAETLRRAAHAAYKLAKSSDPPPPPARAYERVTFDYSATIVTHSVTGASP